MTVMARAWRALSWCGATLALAAGAVAHAGPREQRLEDFDALRRAIEGSYAYPAALPAWKRHAARWRERAAAAADEEAFVTALEGTLDGLRDDHVTLSRRTRHSPRRVPEEADLWARFDSGRARIDAVRISSEADAAGVLPGTIVTRIEGVEVARAVDARLGREGSSAERDWALRHLLAGPRRGTFTLELEGRGREVAIERHAARTASAALARRVGEQRDIGYLRLRFAGTPPSARQLDEAFAALPGMRAFILDLRDSTGPATHAEMNAVLGRFATHPGVWQIRIARDGRRHADRVSPLPSASHVPLVVLVDRWTQGDAEALAVGLRAVAGATLLGTPMAGLRGATGSARLRHSGIVVRFPVERAAAPDGTAREDVLPDVAVDLAAPSGGPGDPILYQALKRLERP